MTNKQARAASLSELTSTVDGGALDSDPQVIAIQLLAYDIFLSRGAQHGDDLADWLEAERIVTNAASG
jgi:Protein of unknown function (DUF2934)